MNRFACSATFLFLAGAARAQEAVKAGDFDVDAGGWTAFKVDSAGLGEDPSAKLAVVHDDVKAGKGALRFSYDVVPGTLRMAGLHRDLGLAGMKSLRLWAKCSAATALVIQLTERNGASFQCAFSVPAGAWQEVAVNLDEFVVDDASKDGNGRLDADEIAAIGIFDIAGFLAMMLPDLKGPRTLDLDDVVFAAKPVPATSGRAQITKAVPVYKVDSFESPLIRWVALSLDFSEGPKIGLFDPVPAIDTAAAPSGGGKQSLRLIYPRSATRVYGLMRGVEKVDLSKATGVDLWLRTSTDGTFIVNLEEKDGSRYNRMVTLSAAEGWKPFSFGLGSFTLADDSTDENGRLDAAQIKQVLVADASALTGAPAVERTTLWIDEVLFTLEE
jgi:hypothetical protein